MKTIIQQVKVIVLGLIVAGGLSYAFAWTGPTATPPNGNVSAPLNVGYTTQIKYGGLIVNGSTTATYPNGFTTFGLSQFYGNSVFNGAIQIIDGTQGNGKVLYSDASGNASWIATSSLGISTTNQTGVSKIVAGSNITVSPTTGIGNVTVNAVIPSVSGTVGGGCYGTVTNGTSGVTFTTWGNATGGCSCPTGYTKVESASANINPYSVNTLYATAYLCVSN